MDRDDEMLEDFRRPDPAAVDRPALRLNDCLVSMAGGAETVVLRGEGTAALAMNKADYANPEFKYAFSEWLHAPPFP